MPKAYLTIDDSPSSQMSSLCDALAKRNIFALFFCRGDFLQSHLDEAVSAINQGFILANHAYSHRPFGDLSYEECIEEIEKTEELLDVAYQKADTQRPGRHFRFPYLDRGDGDRLERRFDGFIQSIQKGEDVSLPSSDKVERLQNYLRAQNFMQPFTKVNHPLYSIPDIQGSADCMLTYSSCDWMLREKYKGAQPYQTREDLVQRLQRDPYVPSEEITSIILFHDHEELTESVLYVVGSMQDQGFEFLEYASI